jgi:transposase InsO family protein
MGPGEPSGDRILAPTLPNRTWHLDLTSLRILWIHFTIGAVLDGYSRKLLGLKLFLSYPTTKDMTHWVKNVISSHGAPRFLVTDRGGQFKKRFRIVLMRWGIQQVQGRKRSCCFNGKVERFFRTLKAWQRVALLFCSASRLQMRLDRFRRYYNSERPSLAIAGNTPESAWCRKRRIDCRRFFAADPIQPAFRIQRVGFEGDSTLPVARITTELQFKRIA